MQQQRSSTRCEYYYGSIIDLLYEPPTARTFMTFIS